MYDCAGRGDVSSGFASKLLCDTESDSRCAAQTIKFALIVMTVSAKLIRFSIGRRLASIKCSSYNEKCPN